MSRFEDVMGFIVIGMLPVTLCVVPWIAEVLLH